MQPDDEKLYHSLDRETGMLQDINELRSVVLQLASLAEMLMGIATNPFLAVILQGAVAYDVAALIVVLKSYAKTLSQADASRLFCSLVGSDMEKVEREIKAQGLSETLPPTHPDVPNVELDEGMLNSPIAKESIFLSEQAKAYTERKQERVVLPESLEQFLRSLGEGNDERD